LDADVVVCAPVHGSNVANLCEQIRTALANSPSRRVDCDIGSIDRPDAATVDALARMQLAARRLGGNVRFRRVSDEMLQLLSFIGLEDVLLAEFDGGVEPCGQPEEREQCGGPEERVDLADPPA